VTSAGSQTNREAIVFCDAESRLQDRSRRALKPIRIGSSKYLNDRVEQDHRRIKRRVRSMLGFKTFHSAAITLTGIDDGSHDAQAPRLLRLQPSSFAQGAVRGNRRLKSVLR
jgi:transposase-like protein